MSVFYILGIIIFLYSLSYAETTVLLEKNARINIEHSCEERISPLSNSTKPITYLQPIRFKYPAKRIRIGLPMADEYVSSQTWVQIGVRNAYSPEVIPETLSAKFPLTFNESSGIAYTPYFLYEVNPFQSYLIRIHTRAPYGLTGCKVSQNGCYEKASLYVTSIEVYSNNRRIDPYGFVKLGTTLKISIRVIAPNVNWERLRAYLSYRVKECESNRSKWVSTKVKFKPSVDTSTLQGNWVLPLNAKPGQYDLMVKLTHPGVQSSIWEEQAEFYVTDRTDLLVEPTSQFDKLTSNNQPILIPGIYIQSRGWYKWFNSSFKETILLTRGEGLWILTYPLTNASEDLLSQWTLIMSIRLQGNVWFTLPSPELSPEGYLWTKWIIPFNFKPGPYEIRFQVINNNGSYVIDQIINEAFIVVEDEVVYQEWGNDGAYIDWTHQLAIPLVIETTPSPINYSLSYVDPSHIQVIPQTTIMQTKWSLLNLTEVTDFSIPEATYEIDLSDLNGDGELEIILATSDCIEVRKINGELIWRYPLPAVSDQMKVEDIDGDGFPEILITTLMVPQSPYGMIIVLDYHGNLKWQREVLSNAHGIAVWYPPNSLFGQIIVGTCANMVYVFSYRGDYLNFKSMVKNEWSSIDSIVVEDLDGDGVDEFILGLWRTRQADLWITKPTLEIISAKTMDSLGLTYDDKGFPENAVNIFDGIALTSLPEGGQSIWVVTSPLPYNSIFDPILLQIDGPSGQVRAEYHLSQFFSDEYSYYPSWANTIKIASWDQETDRVFIKVSGQLLLFDDQGLRGVFKIPGGKIMNASTLKRNIYGDYELAVSYWKPLTNEYRIKLLKNPKLIINENPIFLYNPETMRNQLVVNFKDVSGLQFTKIVNLE